MDLLQLPSSSFSLPSKKFPDPKDTKKHNPDNFTADSMQKLYEAADEFLDLEGLYIMAPSCDTGKASPILKMSPTLQTIKTLSEKSLLSTQDGESIIEEQEMGGLAIPSFLLKRAVSFSPKKIIEDTDTSSVLINRAKKVSKSAIVPGALKESLRILSVKSFLKEDEA